MAELGAFGAFDEGANDGWTATPAASTEDAFAGVQMQAQMPAMGGAMGSGFGGGAAAASEDDDLTEEEKQAVAAATARQDEIKASLHTKMVQEQQDKEARRVAGTQAILKWKDER